MENTPIERVLARLAVDAREWEVGRELMRRVRARGTALRPPETPEEAWDLAFDLYLGLALMEQAAFGKLHHGTRDKREIEQLARLLHLKQGAQDQLIAMTRLVLKG